MEAIIDQWLGNISTLIGANPWLAPVMALAAGLLTSFTPCALSSIPLVIGYVGGTGNRDPRRAFFLSLVFSAGSAVTFAALGTAAALLGRLMLGSGSWWYLVLGMLMLLMALQTWEIINFVPSSYALGNNPKRGYFGAFLAGILGGFFSSPCATPVLVTLLAVVAGEGSLLRGILLLLLYSIGHSVLVLIAGTSVGLVQKVSSSSQYGVASRVLKVVMGTAIFLLSLYMFYLGF